MSPIKLTRDQERRMKKLGERVGKITDADRRYFERFPDRHHRVRLASSAETEQQEIVQGEPIWMPPGCAIFTIVKNLAPGVRMRMFTRSPAGADTDLTEEQVRAIFEAIATPRSREIKASLRVAEART